MNPSHLSDVVQELLGKAPVRVPLLFVPLTGGRNNRVYHFVWQGRDYVVKHYFSDPSPLRDRLESEFAFATFLWRQGLRTLAEPIAAEVRHRIAVFAFVPGRRLRPEDINSDRVEDVLCFCEAINLHRNDPAGAGLPPAAEACFSLEEHLQTVERRVLRLASISYSHPLERAVGQFARGTLEPLWRELANQITNRAHCFGYPLNLPLATEERCLSPSDLGFHNTIWTSERKLVFHDFEYAGWDDPAKVVADFFNQPALPVDESYRERFAQRLYGALGLSAWHHRRAALIVPLYRLKWCCIMLNEFLAEGGRRREYAAADRLTVAEKRSQLQLAKHLAVKLQRDLDCPDVLY